MSSMEVLLPVLWKRFTKSVLIHRHMNTHTHTLISTKLKDFVKKTKLKDTG